MKHRILKNEVEPMKPTLACLVAALILSLAANAPALINPAVQPGHLFDLYDQVFAATVERVDGKGLTVELKVEDAAKGALPYDRISVTGGEPERLNEVLSLEKGQRVVVFAGRQRPLSRQRDALYYLGGGTWHKARAGEAPSSAAWTLVGNADDGLEAGSADIMFGVFNGAVDNLWRMMRDRAAGRAYFPATPFTRFSAHRIGTLPTGVGGVGLCDVDGDGRLDLIATSSAGCRVFVQAGDGTFEDRSKASGIAEVQAHSIGIADVDGDGNVDLLLDGSLYLCRDGAHVRDGMLPELMKVRSAAFVELNHDGFPDVLVSLEGGGLRAFLNPFGSVASGGGTRAVATADDGGTRAVASAPDGEPVVRGGDGAPPSTETPATAFLDVTATVGLDVLDGQTGYFETGDWNGDGRTDILYLGGPGALLLRTDEGFDQRPLAEEGEEPTYATAAIAPVVDPSRNAAFILMADGKRLIEERGNDFDDITRYGNEIQDDVPGLRMALVEDLNADGTLDLHAFNGTTGSPDFYLDNRGYGSFMLPEKYRAGLWPGEVCRALAKGGAAAGDVTGDGANDLLVGGADGSLWLLINETLADRAEKAAPETLRDERKRIEARSVTVIPQGTKGIVGAWVRLRHAERGVVAARQLAGNVGVGCAPPHRVVLTVREPGDYEVEVAFADGRVHREAVSLAADGPRHRTLRVPRQQSAGVPVDTPP